MMDAGGKRWQNGTCPAMDNAIGVSGLTQCLLYDGRGKRDVAKIYLGNPPRRARQREQ